jgi:predicted flap endonuclease-1-like 5' DNA nuclease
MMADYSLGVSLLKREDETLHDYMVSFSPLAPFFGVPWRFAGAVGFAPLSGQAQAPAPQSRVKPDVEDAQPAEPEPASKAAASAAKPAAEDDSAAVGEAPALLYDAAPEGADDLTRIKGVGPKLAAELNGMGIYTFAQVADLSPENLAWIDTNLTSFRGRSVRDDWVGQAAELLAS